MFGKYRLVSIISAVVVIGFFVTTVVSYRVAEQSLSEQLSGTTLPLTSDNVYSEIQQDLLRPIYTASLMAQDTFLRDWVIAGEHDPTQIQKYLSEIKGRYGVEVAFFISDFTNAYYSQDGLIRHIDTSKAPDSIWYPRVRRMGDPFEVNVDYHAEQPNHVSIFINYKVFDYQGNFIGVTGVGLALEVVEKLIEVYQRRYGRTVYFVDRQGQVMLSGSGFEGPKGLRERSGMAPIVTTLLAQPSGSYAFEDDGETVYVNARLVPEFKWYLIVEQRSNPAAQKVTETLWANLGISLFILIIVIALTSWTVRRFQGELETMAVTDKLTGALNRHGFEPVLDQGLKAARRDSKPLSVILADIDHFKGVNDTHGHAAGDAVIRAVVDVMGRQRRASDVLCRWGGEEFLILLPDCSLNAAVELAERTREAIARTAVPAEGKDLNVTASFGVATLKPEEGGDGLLSRADTALYAAKHGGRNKVETAR